MAVLKQVELGLTVADATRQLGISEQTFYRWKKLHGGLQSDRVRELKQLQEESARLKRVVAELTLDKALLRDVFAKEEARLKLKRCVVDYLVRGHGVSECRACRVVKLHCSNRYYRSCKDPPLELRADARDHADPGAIWIPARACFSQARRLATGPQPAVSAVPGRATAATVEAAPATQDDRRAARASVRTPAERCMGHGLRGRPTRQRHVAARADDPIRPVLAGGQVAGGSPAGHYCQPRLWRRVCTYLCRSSLLKVPDIGYPPAPSPVTWLPLLPWRLLSTFRSCVVTPRPESAPAV